MFQEQCKMTNRGGYRGQLTSLKPTKVIFTKILYKSENNIRNIKPKLFCHSSVVKYTSSLLQ